MKGNLYKFTVEHLQDKKGNAVESEPLVFEAVNHDDLFKIVEVMKGKMDLDEEDATAFAFGLKLFGEVLLKNKENELLKQLKPNFTTMMKEIKKP